MDIFLYNGDISRGNDLKFIETVFKEKKSKKCSLILVTPGGDPDSAYKVARYIQDKYESFTLIVAGLCKSAGTLLAIGATEVVFMPYGELGPLDVQMSKVDSLAGLESGLNTSEAFRAIEERARETFSAVISDIMSASNGIVSFHTASRSATDMIASLYGPIFARIDPEEVGSRSRAMRIGEDYGKRLNRRWTNLKPKALERLSRSYPSHGFVIDRMEAEALFERVREPTEIERQIITKLGMAARHPQNGLTIQKIITIGDGDEKSEHSDETSAAPEGAASSKRARPLNGRNPRKPEPGPRAKASEPSQPPPANAA